MSLSTQDSIFISLNVWFVLLFVYSGIIRSLENALHVTHIQIINART